MLLADLLLIVLIWLDATLAQTVAVNREPLPALSVGHTGEVVYRWSNPSSRAARLNVREVRPEILGGPQPARAFRIPAKAALREWVPGDDLRHIDWKATARRGKVITRQYEAERRQQVLLVLDTGRLMTADVAAGVARLDFAVQAALELAYAAAQHDDNVGIMTFADGVQHFVAPERGRTGVRRVMDVLAEVQPKLVEPDYPGAFRYLAARNRKRALTVLFTDVIDRFASDALVANVATLRPRHLPLAVTLRNPELDAAAMQRPATP